MEFERRRSLGGVFFYACVLSETSRIVRLKVHKNNPHVGILDNLKSLSIDGQKTARYNILKKFILKCQFFNEQFPMGQLVAYFGDKPLNL